MLKLDQALGIGIRRNFLKINYLKKESLRFSNLSVEFDYSVLIWHYTFGIIKFDMNCLGNNLHIYRQKKLIKTLSKINL